MQKNPAIKKDSIFQQYFIIVVPYLSYCNNEILYAIVKQEILNAMRVTFDHSTEQIRTVKNIKTK